MYQHNAADQSQWRCWKEDTVKGRFGTWLAINSHRQVSWYRRELEGRDAGPWKAVAVLNVNRLRGEEQAS
jgi:hypothetical protein